MTSTTTRRRSAAVLAALALAATPLLGGCFSGLESTTSWQSQFNSGNGVQQTVGDVSIENATLVRGPEGSGSATLIGTVFNAAGADDAIVAVTINGTPAMLTPGSEIIPAGGSTSFGYDGTNFINTYAFKAEPSAFVPVTVQFANAGLASLSVMTVAPVGVYEGIAPTPAMG